MKQKRLDLAYVFIILCLALGMLYGLAHVGYAFDHASPKADEARIVAAVSLLQENIGKPGLILKPLADQETMTFKLTLLGAIFMGIYLMYKLSTRKKFRKGEEHGSARWATDKETKKLIDPKAPDNNIILTDNVQLGLNTRVTRKNNNVLAIGGAGAGKTRFYVKPNIMQMNTNYVITDPKGELLRSTGKMLEKNGYTVKVFNLINMRNSFNYNAFAYLADANGNYSDANVIKLINVLMKNTKKEGQSSGEQFWEDSTEALLLALAFFLVYEGNEDEKNFPTMMELMQLAEAKEEDEDYKSPLDIMFEDLEAQDKYHPAVKYYKVFKKAAGKTAKSILISAAVRLKAFNNQDVVNLTHKDTINIHDLAEKKTALFVVIPDSDDTFNFLVAMLYTQIFDVLYGLADFKFRGRLPRHVRFMLDEFANIGTIPQFDKLIATMRSREISVNPIIQNLAQLKKMYKDSWETIVGNSDTLLFLGGKEQSSLEYISKALGKETIDTINRNISRSARSSSTSQNEGILGRELMTADELSRMPDSDCVLLVRGMYPFYSKKFRIERHRNYSQLEDADPRNEYDISNLITDVMPHKHRFDSDLEEFEDQEEEINKILNENGEDGIIMSKVEIPPDEDSIEEESQYEEEDVIRIAAEVAATSEGQILNSVSAEGGPDSDFRITNLDINEGDVLSEESFEDLGLDDSDEYVVPEDEI